MIAARIISTSLIAFLFFSCGEQAQPAKVDSTPPAPATVSQALPDTVKATPISNTGFTVKLLPGFRIEQDPHANAWYLTPVDPKDQRGEGGLYIGPKPDKHPPSTDYSKEEIPGLFLGQPASWIEYTTTEYTQREIFIDETDSTSIHAWYYSSDFAELERLKTMMETISR